MNKFTSTTTQLDLVMDALKWLSKQTGVPYEELSNHMMVIGDVVRVLEAYGSVAGEPTSYDYGFEKRPWDGVYELISQIWHEDTDEKSEREEQLTEALDQVFKFGL